MKKRLLCILLALSLLLTAGCAGPATVQTIPVQTVPVQTDPAETSREETEETQPDQTEPPSMEVELPQVEERHYGVAMPYETVPKVAGVTITPYSPRTPHTVDGVEPYSDWRQDTIPGDLRSEPELAYTLTLGDATVFAGGEPEGYDRNALMNWGMDPGLNVSLLHRHGFTGQGAVIAYIDQPIASHPQYDGVNIHYTNLSDSDNSMHGPAVLSLLAGTDIGTAPEAEVYFYGHSSWKLDQLTHAEALYAIIEQNKLLPEGEKITMVGFSDNIDPREANSKAFEQAVQACRDSGVMVFFCGEYSNAAFIPMSDRNDYRNVVPDHHYGGGQDLLVPAGSRTTAATQGGSQYIYWASAGLSWTMPYMLGLYAIALELDPTLTEEDLLSLAWDTAYRHNGARVVNPVGMIAQALAQVGREEEAQVLLEESSYNQRYTYVVLNSSAMSKEDLRGVELYCASLPDTTVLLVDVRNGISATDIYRAIQADAWTRDGIVEGVQILGTPNMVAAFRPGYRVQMTNGVDEMDTMESDLFYGNLLNEASQLSGYNVLDHFEKGWDVVLAPCWPVARLPLERGEFAPFFAKFFSYARNTGLAQPELVNFSNPIFAATQHVDDMGAFLLRADREFGILKVPYRLYGNQDGEFPVTGTVEGNFTTENLMLENQKGPCEFLINSHGQWNNIDQAIYVDGRERRISFLNMQNIDSVLGASPYYLDLWTCNNGYGMRGNLTTAALKGMCVGVFSATHIISNNGVNCRASLEDMQKSNFYYFYLNYFAALNQGASRSMAFCFAQQTYAQALMEDSENGIRSGEGNYQFNLCNLLAYHNFGLLGPKTGTSMLNLEQEQQDAQIGASENPVKLFPEEMGTLLENTLGDRRLEILDVSVGIQPNGSIRYRIEFVADAGMEVLAFSPPNGNVFRISGPKGNGSSQVFTFVLTPEELEQGEMVVISFYYSDSCRVFYRIRDLSELAGSIEKLPDNL